jgi:Na+-transporting NADH:ubiquinone oxidoreductase subunit C
MSNYVKSIIFAAVLSIVCGSLLTLASTGLKEFQLKNVAIDKQKNILKSVGLIRDKQKLSQDAIDRLYSDNIRHVWVNPEGNIVSEEKKTENDLLVYFYQERGKIKSYIIPIDSRGVWGRILGYLAIKNDGATVAGFTVFSHSETPGLGGEIEKSWFQKNFVGKKILDNAGNLVSVSIAKGAVKGKIPESLHENYVDGISGATLTGKFLSAGLKETLVEYEPLSKKFRKNMIKWQ